MTRHLVVFAKAPRLGTAKRRLAAQIGAVEAARFYREALRATLARCARDERWRLWLCVAPDAATGHRAWRAAGGRATVIAQGRGDLGARMARPFRSLPPGPVVLIGSDIPAITNQVLAAAFQALGTHDLVFGPARDGGFWLIGARRLRPWPRDLFRDVRWSTSHALADTRANIGPRLSVAFVETLEDVDDSDSHRRWKEART